MADRPPEELQALLRHEDMRVRLAAQFELARRDASAPLLAAARQTEHQLARLHGIWGLGQVIRSGNDEPAGSLFALLDDADPEVRAQAARVLGETGYEPAVDKLITLLGDEPRVQLYAAEAVGKLEDARAFTPLVELLAALDLADAHLRHAATYALSRLGDETALTDLAQHPSRTIRLSAVVALRRLHAQGVAIFLEDRDPLVVMEAARAIHDDESISAVLPALARLLTPGLGAEEALLRRAINANLRIGDEASAGRLAAYAADSQSPSAFRAIALQALAAWPMPPVLDRVEGRYRMVSPHQPDAARTALAPALTDLLDGGPQEVRIAAADAVRKLKPADAEQTVYAMAVDTDNPAPVRQAALRAMASL
jgi:HEAT repeat protein